jgi:NPCBM/NEW2 domain
VKKHRTAAILAAAVWFTGSVGNAQNGHEGHVNYLAYALSFLDPWTSTYSSTTQQWLQTHFGSMVSWSPYADGRTWWWPRTNVYHDLYAIQPGSWAATAHPEWILKDQYGHWLYIPWACQNGTCPQYAGDVANPAFRAYIISDIQAMVSRGNYAGLFIDDSNMEFRVSDGWQNELPPVDTNTGQLMTWAGWRSYIATFEEQIRAAFPNQTLMENVIWYASGGSGVPGQDPYIQRQFRTANIINLERGVASDPGFTGGTGFWSVYSFFNFIDTVHAAGAGVNLGEYQLDPAEQEYGLASWFLISNGLDSLGDNTATPANWFSGYSLDLGSALGPRTYSNGVFQRNFTGGMVLLAEPGLGGQTISLPGAFQRLDGSWVSSVYLQGGQAAILIGSSPVAPPAPPAGGVSHYVSDLTPTYVANGWGTVGINTSVGGGPITIAGTQYAHGLGVHAFSELDYPLPPLGGCSSFTATVGVDDEVWWGLGQIQFQVWADGVEAWASSWLDKGTPAPSVNLNVTGVQKLVLIVANNGSIDWDHADWANAQLVCAN